MPNDMQWKSELLEFQKKRREKVRKSILENGNLHSLKLTFSPVPLSQPRSHATFSFLKIDLRSEFEINLCNESLGWVSRSKSATTLKLQTWYLSLSLCKSQKVIRVAIGWVRSARPSERGWTSKRILEETTTQVVCSIRTRGLCNGRRKSSSMVQHCATLDNHRMYYKRRFEVDMNDSLVNIFSMKIWKTNS